MSVNYYLCKTNGKKGPVGTWQEDYSLPLSTPDNVKKELANLFPFVKWHFGYGNEWFGLGTGGETHVDVNISETDGVVDFIVLRGGSPGAMQRIMELFNLNHCSSLDELINPFEYNDDFELIDE